MFLTRSAGRCVTLSGLVALACYPGRSSAATQYNLVMLNTAPFGGGQAYGIYNGQAAGAGFTGALYWPNPTTSISLNPAGFTSSGAFGISGNQQVGVAYDQGHQQHAMLWNGTAASAVNLSPTPNTVCYATATDEAQQVGVIAGPTAALWSGTAASFVSLNPADFSESTATGVANGVQVGYGRDVAGLVALAWHGSANSFTVLRVGGEALGIAPDGQIVGLVGAHATNEAALWTDGTPGSFLDIAPAGTTASELFATNGFRQVGDVSFLGGGNILPTDRHAGVWAGTAGSFQLLPIPAGDNFSVATGIDAQGNISGYVGIDVNGGVGGQVPVIWQPIPEPSAMIAVAVTAILVGRRKT